MKSFNLCAVFAFNVLLTLAAAQLKPECDYTTLKGDYVGLYYSDLLKKGQSIMDFGHNANEVCVQRATCVPKDDGTYETKIDKCSDVNKNCNKLKQYGHDFPACCFKC